MITEIIFSDYYRTFFLCILSVGLAFLMRNADIKKRIFAFVSYELTMILLFLWIFILCMIFTECDYESIKSIITWEMKWILYFSIITVIQFILYYFLWNKSNILKIVTLLFIIIAAISPLCIFDLFY